MAQLPASAVDDAPAAGPIPASATSPTAPATLVAPTSSQPATAPAAPISPTHARKHSTSLADTLPLDHPSRTQPIHSSLPHMRLLPDPGSTSSTNINPLSLEPFTPAELSANKYDELRAKFVNDKGDVDAVKLAAEQEEVVRQIRARMDERERKQGEIDKEIGEMEKIREVERKIWRRRMGGKEGV